MSRPLGVLLAALATAAPLLTAARAEAQATQSAHITNSNWRQRDRTSALREGTGSSQRFTFELRFGPYYPEIDESPAAQGGPYGSTPYASAFGGGAQLYFGMELDYLPLRIPFVGAIGPGFGWGITSTSGKTVLESDPTQTADEETSLLIMPMHLSAVLRVDELMRRTGIPLVAYGKLGYGLGYWSSSDAAGTSIRRDAAGVKLEGSANKAAGLTPGIHFALGGMLSLNFIDPRSSARLDETMSINHVYIFGEWMNTRLTGFGSDKKMYIGTSTFVGGLALDM